MKTLAFESSTTRGTVALFQDRRLIEHLEFPNGQRTARSFALVLDQLLTRHLASPAEIDLVALTAGPGSFTGLRIAVTAAKALAFATESQIVALNTLDVLVHQLPSGVTQACAVMDAQRQQFFAAYYQRMEDSDWTVTQPCHIVDQRQLLEQLPADVMLTGPGLLKVSDQLQSKLLIAARDMWAPQAATVGQLAWGRHVDGHYDDLWSLKPEYYRPSYAQEKRRT